MAVGQYSGNTGALSVTPVSPDSAATTIQTVYLTGWKLESVREMADISGKGLSYRSWAPSSFTWWLHVVGTVSSSGVFLNKSIAEIALNMGGSEIVSGLGWLEKYQTFADVDSTVRFSGTYRMTNTWDSPT